MNRKKKSRITMAVAAAAMMVVTGCAYEKQNVDASKQESLSSKIEETTEGSVFNLSTEQEEALGANLLDLSYVKSDKSDEAFLNLDQEKATKIEDQMSKNQKEKTITEEKVSDQVERIVSGQTNENVVKLDEKTVETPTVKEEKVVAETKTETNTETKTETEADTKVEEKTEKSEETAAQVANAVQTNDVAQTVNEEQSNNDVQASDTEKVSFIDRILYTSKGAYTDYFVGDFSFAADGLSGTFKISTYDSYSKEYVDSLKIGDTIANGYRFTNENGSTGYEDILIETLERDDVYSRVLINNTYYFELQENGEYYLDDGNGFMNTTFVGERTLQIAPDVMIVDNANAFWKEGILASYYGAEYYSSVAEFVDRLDDEDVWYFPNLLMRVENDEVKVIVVNPANHEPWHN